MKNGIKDLTQKFENELSLKEKKSIYINETNEKLFNDMMQKNKKLVNDIKKYIELNNQLISEKTELENMLLEQELKLKSLKRVYSLPDQNNKPFFSYRSNSFLINNDNSLKNNNNEINNNNNNINNNNNCNYNNGIFNMKRMNKKRNSSIETLSSIRDELLLPTIK